MPATDDRTGGAALFDSSNHHIASRSKSLPVLAARNSRQHGGYSDVEERVRVPSCSAVGLFDICLVDKWGMHFLDVNVDDLTGVGSTAYADADAEMFPIPSILIGIE